MSNETSRVTDLKDLRDLGTAVRGTQAPAAAPRYERKVDAQGRSYATGKRKDAIARVWIKPGNGKITVNDRDILVYFARPVLRMMINQPFGVVNRAGQFDVVCTVVGGGPFRPGRRGPSRHQPRADPVRAGPAAGAEAGRVPDPRQPHRRAQEVRPRQGAPQLPVLEALSASGAKSTAKAGHRPGLSLFRRSSFLWRLHVPELDEQQQVVGDLEAAADHQRPGAE